MKRKLESTQQQEEEESAVLEHPSSDTTTTESKKIKTTCQLLPSNLFSIISNDEFLLVLQFLSASDIDTLSQTSKWMYQSVHHNVFQYLCKYVVDVGDDAGSILNALENKERFVIEYHYENTIETSMYNNLIDIIEDICDCGGSLSDLTNHLVLKGEGNSFNSSQIVELMDFRSVKQQYRTDIESNDDILDDSVVCDSMDVNTVIIEHLFDFYSDSYEDDQYDDYFREPLEENCAFYQLVKIVGIPIGFTLKNLTLSVAVDYNDIFMILSKCFKLESLRVNGYKWAQPRDYPRQEYDEEGNLITLEKPISEEYEENCYFVPVLTSMKKLQVMSTTNIPREKLLLDLIKCCPNLEHLHYCFRIRLDEYMLKSISKYCKNLTHVTFHSGSSPSLESRATDSQLFEFMKSQSKLKHFEIDPIINVDGSIYAKIGETCPNLEHLAIIAHGNNFSRCKQVEEITFGGGALPKLKELLLGDLYVYGKEENESLVELAPNLEVFKCGKGY